MAPVPITAVNLPVCKARVVKRIVLLDDYQGIALDYGGWDRIPDEWQVVALEQHIDDPEELVAALSEAAVVVAMRERTKLPAAVLGRLPELKLLITTGMSNVAIDVAAAKAAGVVVCGTGINASPTAELAWGLILALLRNIPAEDANLRAGGWQSTIGGDLEGAALGLVGLGRLGRRMVPVAQAFGMDVLAWSQNLDPAAARALGVEPVEKLDLFGRSDVISVHYRLSERSRGIVGAAEIGAMKPSAYLVNTSRGPLVDTEALLAALVAGTIAGAGIDVYEAEPLPADHPLRGAPRAVLTPHLGYVTEDTYATFFGDAVEDVLAWLDGAPIRLLEG
ncbi:MAG: D-2-hydroxyacid dehydrogenase family protein [Actinobacteria bacterium]|nr:D-2-hydroxyacid dehydrogenase family protein [Actinomycetota bacterium]